MNKMALSGEPEHKFNHVYFIVYTENLYYIQGCYDDTYCSKNGVKSYTKLGKIEDDVIAHELNQWKLNHKYQNWYSNSNQIAESWTPPHDELIISCENDVKNDSDKNNKDNSKSQKSQEDKVKII